MPTLKMFKEER